jgi:taurine dioxygenase
MTRVIMVEAYARLPEFIQARIAPLRPRHSIEARFGAVLPIEKRLALKAQYPDIKRGGRPLGMAPEPWL